MQIGAIGEPPLRLVVRHGGYINPDPYAALGKSDSVAIVPPRRYTVERLLQMGRRCRCIMDWNKFNPEVDRGVAELVRPYGQASTSSRALNDIPGNRVRGVSMASTTTSESQPFAPKEENTMVKENVACLNENNYAKADPGFANFLKKHSSPTHQRVTAGGRIVPMEKAAPPKFHLNFAGGGSNTVTKNPTYDPTKRPQPGVSYGVSRPLDGVYGDPRFGGYQATVSTSAASDSLPSRSQAASGHVPGIATMPEMAFSSLPSPMMPNPSFQSQGLLGNCTWIPTSSMGNPYPSLQPFTGGFPAAPLFNTAPRIPLGAAVKYNDASLPELANRELLSPVLSTPPTDPGSTFSVPLQPTQSSFVSPLPQSNQAMSLQNALGPMPTSLDQSMPPAYPSSNGNTTEERCNEKNSATSFAFDNQTTIKCLEDAEKLLEAKKQELQAFNREVAHFELQHRIVITAEGFPRHQEVVRHRHEELQHDISMAAKAKQHFEKLNEKHASAVVDSSSIHDQAAEIPPKAYGDRQFTSHRSRLNVEAATFAPISPAMPPKIDWDASAQSLLRRPTNKQSRTPLLAIQPRASRTTQTNSSMEQPYAEMPTEHIQNESGSQSPSPPTKVYQNFLSLGGTAFDGTNHVLTSERTPSFRPQGDTDLMSAPPDSNSSVHEARFRHGLEERFTEAKERQVTNSHAEHMLWTTRSQLAAEKLTSDAKKYAEEQERHAKDVNQGTENFGHRKLTDEPDCVKNLLLENNDDPAVQSTLRENLQSQKRFENYQDQVLDALRQDPGVHTLVRLWNDDKSHEIIGIGKLEPKTDKEWEALDDSERRYWIRKPDSFFVKGGAARPDYYQMEDECDDFSKQSVASSGTIISNGFRHNQVQAEKRELAKAGWKDPASSADAGWVEKAKSISRIIRNDNNSPARRQAEHAAPNDPAWLDTWIRGISVEEFLKKKRKTEHTVAQNSYSKQSKEPVIYYESEVSENMSVAVVQKLAAQGHVEPVSGAAKALGGVMGSQPSDSPTRIRQFGRTYLGTPDQQPTEPALQREPSHPKDAKLEATKHEVAARERAVYEAAVGVTDESDSKERGDYIQYLECIPGLRPKALALAKGSSMDCQRSNDDWTDTEDGSERGSPFKRRRTSPFRRRFAGDAFNAPSQH